mgnify:CR=1 FL=1
MGGGGSDKPRTRSATKSLTGPSGRVGGFSDPAIRDSARPLGHVDRYSSVCNRMGGLPTNSAGVWSYG